MCKNDKKRICIHRFYQLEQFRDVLFKMNKIDAANVIFIVLSLEFIGICQLQNCIGPMFERYFGYALSQDLENLAYSNKTFVFSTDMVTSCRKTCLDDNKCQAFTTNFKTLSCRLYQAVPERNLKFFQTQLLPNSDGVYFKKSCFKNAINCTYLWQFDHLPGSSLSFNDDIAHTRLVSSLEECQELCLTERTIPCRSAMFNVQTKTCKLSSNDRRTMPKAMGAGKIENLYVENQCGTDLITSCSFTQEHGLALSFGLESQSATNRSECEQKCVDENKFVCRSYHFDSLAKLCKLGTEDSFSTEAAHNSSAIRAAYFQRNECTDVQVICDANRMMAKFRLDRQFDGKIFSLKQPTRCQFDFKAQFEFNVSLPLDQGDKCGIITEDKNTLSTMMQMQYHDAVKTARDKILKIICKYDLAGQTVQSFVEVNESSGTFQTSLGTGGSGQLPEAVMRIVNGEGQTVTTAEVGQILYAEVLLRDANGSISGPSEYGLFVTGCEAYDEGQKVILIDQFGCPIDTALFEGFYPVAGSDNRILRAAFQGFRFQTKRRVNINCNVNFCFRFCQPNLCTDRNGRRVMSYGKKRKRRNAINRMEHDFVGQANVESQVFFNEATEIVLESEPFKRNSYHHGSTTTKNVQIKTLDVDFDSMIMPGVAFFGCLLLVFLFILGYKLFKIVKTKE